MSEHQQDRVAGSDEYQPPERLVRDLARRMSIGRQTVSREACIAFLKEAHRLGGSARSPK